MTRSGAALRERWQTARSQLRFGEGLVSRFARGAQWNTVAVGFTVGTNVLGNILFARILGRHEYGAYGLVQSTLVTAVALSSQLGGAAAMRYVSQFRWNEKERAGRIIGLNILVSLALSGIVALGLIAFSPLLADRLFHASRLVPAILLGALIVPLMTVNAVNLGALAGFEDFAACARITGLGSIAYLIAGAAGAMTYGVPGAMLGGLTGLSVQCALSFYALRKTALANDIRVRFRGAMAEAGSLFRINIPSFFAGLTPMAAIWVGQIMLLSRTDSFGELALYNSSSTIRSGVVILPYVLYTVTSSLINAYHAQGDRDRFRRLFWLNIWSTVAVAVVIAVVCALAAPAILSAFGRDFARGRPILLILLAGAVMEATVASMHPILLAREMLWQSLFFISIPRDLTISVLAVLLVPAHGAQGLAVAYVGGWIVGLVSTIVIVRHAGVEPSSPVPLPTVTPAAALQE